MAKTRVLLVDDEKSFTTLLRLNLEATGQYEVEVVNWAEDTLAVARKFIPDIILLDIIMPRMPGGNVAAEIQADEELKGTPIVFLTAAVRRQQVEEAEGVICDLPCLAKPASMEEVVAMIEKYARRGSP
jgi:CheY-like chemotaxis protein